VHGNASLAHSTINAARALVAFGAPASLLVHPGAPKPLIRDTLAAEEIHGSDGLGGSEGFPLGSDEAVKDRIVKTHTHAVEAIKAAVVASRTSASSSSLAAQGPDASGQKLVLVATGALTNVALFLSTYPDLAKEGVEKIVIMGGSVGVGNYSPTAGPFLSLSIYSPPCSRG
jgi:uridine nucleosidase